MSPSSRPIDPQPEPFPTWINGHVFAPGEGMVPAQDQGLLLGLGVFDGLLYQDGHRFFEQRHLDRFAHGARSIGIDWPLPWDPALALDEYCAALGRRDSFVRLSATRGVPGLGPTLVISGREILRPDAGGARVTLAAFARPAAGLGSIKSTSRLGYTLARESALACGAYDALLTARDGEVLEGTVCNVFAVLRGRLVTPGVDRGCLPGIMRALVIEEAGALGIALEERRLDASELSVASEVLLTNTSAGVVGVRALEGLARRAPLPGRAGPVARQLAQAIRARERADRGEAARAAGAARAARSARSDRSDRSDR